MANKVRRWEKNAFKERKTDLSINANILLKTN